MRFIIHILIGLLFGLTNGVQLAEKTRISVEDYVTRNQYSLNEIDSHANIWYENPGIDFSVSGEAVLSKSFRTGLSNSTCSILKDSSPVCQSVSLPAYLIDLPPPCKM